MQTDGFHLVVAGPASHNPALLEEIKALAARLGAALGASGAVAAWFDQGKPTLADALETAVTAGTTRLLVVPYLLQWRYPDQFSLPAALTIFAAAHPAVRIHLARPIGLSSSAEALILERARDALAQPTIESMSGDALRAHCMQDPPAVRTEGVPKYVAPRQHLLICAGRPCLDAGATALEAALRTAIQAAGRNAGPERVQVTRTRCLGPCRGAAIVVDMTSGDWYHGIEPEHATALLDAVEGRANAVALRRFRPRARD
jgi:sirohydrochlorin ferrochelatase/(2Fe-2S) ferredoxin